MVSNRFPGLRSQIGKGGDKLLKGFFLGPKLRNWCKAGKGEGRIFKSDYLPLVSRRSKDCSRASSATVCGLPWHDPRKKTSWRPTRKSLVSNGISIKKPARTMSRTVKPDPDIFITGRKKLGPNLDRSIAIVDTPYDAESAAKAGITTIGVLSGGWTAEQLRSAGCVPPTGMSRIYYAILVVALPGPTASSGGG